MERYKDSFAYWKLNSLLHRTQLLTADEALVRGQQFEISLDSYSQFIQNCGVLLVKYQPGYAQTSEYRMNVSHLESELTNLSPHTEDEMKIINRITGISFEGRLALSDYTDEKTAYVEIQKAKLFEMILKLQSPYIRIFDPHTHVADLATGKDAKYPHWAGFRVAQLTPIVSFDDEKSRFAFTVRGRGGREFSWLPENKLTRVALDLKRVWTPMASDFIQS